MREGTEASFLSSPSQLSARRACVATATTTTATDTDAAATPDASPPVKHLRSDLLHAALAKHRLAAFGGEGTWG